MEPIPGAAPYVTIDMVSSAVSKTKSGKAAGPSGIIAEMLKVSGEPFLQLLADLTNTILSLKIKFQLTGKRAL